MASPFRLSTSMSGIGNIQCQRYLGSPLSLKSWVAGLTNSLFKTSTPFAFQEFSRSIGIERGRTPSTLMSCRIWRKRREPFRHRMPILRWRHGLGVWTRPKEVKKTHRCLGPILRRMIILSKHHLPPPARHLAYKLQSHQLLLRSERIPRRRRSEYRFRDLQMTPVSVRGNR